MIHHFDGTALMASQPPLDEQHFAELTDLMGDDLAELVHAYLRDSVDRLTQLERAFAGADWEQVRRQAHGLKGSSSNLGAFSLVSCCQQLENLAGQGGLDRAAVDAAYHGVRSELSAVQQFLRQRFD